MNPEVEQALAKAQKKYGPNLEGALQQIAQDSRSLKKKHAVHPKLAWAIGRKAKHQGMDRISPYYERPGSDHFWLAGYDGKTMEEAIATQ